MASVIRRSVVVLIASVLLATAAVTSAQAATPQGDVASQTNNHRAAVGVAPLIRNGQLDAVAQEWAAQMSATGNFSHSTSAWRQARIPAGWTTHGENIAYGYQTAAAVMAGWMDP